MDTNKLLQRVYDASSDGLEIITRLLPEAEATIAQDGRVTRKFKLRPTEQTPSAMLRRPDQKYPYWRVVDYGGGQGERRFSPIDLYMRDRGYRPEQFALALHELAEEYGVEEELKRSVNKPDITRRDALPAELGQPPKVALREGFTADELLAWGPRVKAEHLRELGWQAVSEVVMTVGAKTTEKDGQTIVTPPSVITKRPTERYPIFAQTCTYIDTEGQPRRFLKVYEPKSWAKAYRFFIVGSAPQHHIYGLDALRRRFQERGEQKLPEVVITSGGSDAVNLLSLGFQPVWFNSETAAIRADDIQLLSKMARRVILIPDIDATGIAQARTLALQYPQLHVVWMTDLDMGSLHDNRGRRRKDLKDFIQLHPRREDVAQLLARAQSAQWWQRREAKDGHAEYLISASRLSYWLSLHGFYTLRDDTRQEPLYIRVDGVRVSRIVAKTIRNFICEQARREGLDEALIDRLMRSHDLPTDRASLLTERDDLDFSRATQTSQRFFFRNAWVEVTADRIRQHRYSELEGTHVWEDQIIAHDYRQLKPMFSLERRDDGGWAVEIPGVPPSKLLQIVANTSRLHWREAEEGCLELSDEERREEHQCLAAKIACIGYLLHGYKSEAEAWAPICQDARLAESEDECNGGSGKSLFLRAVSRLLNTFYIDAHVPTVTENRFLFDGVTPETDLVIIDECDRRLNFDFFFGRITGDMKGEEKGNHPFLIPFAQSPKMAFATNYTLRRHDASTERRIWPQVFSDYYHEATRQNDYRCSRSIRDDLGCNLMGTDYSEQDWQADIAFMMQCLQAYLSLPREERRIMPPMSRIDRREQMAAVGKDFKQWADDFLSPDSGNLDRELRADEMLAAFNAETRYGWSPKKFAQHLKAYCELAPHIYCLNPASITGRKEDGQRYQKNDESGGKRTCYYIESQSKFETESGCKGEAEQDIQF